MNAERRQKLQEWSKALSTIQGELDSLKDDEVEANENRPEHLQNSEPGDQLQEAVDNLSAAIDNIDAACGE